VRVKCNLKDCGSVPAPGVQLAPDIRFYGHECPQEALVCRTPAAVYVGAKDGVSLTGSCFGL
jgi:hypothetical protein